MKSVIYHGRRNSRFCISSSANNFILCRDRLCFSRFLDICWSWPSISRCTPWHRCLVFWSCGAFTTKQEVLETVLETVYKSAHIFSKRHPGVVKENDIILCLPWRGSVSTDRWSEWLELEPLLIVSYVKKMLKWNTTKSQNSPLVVVPVILKENIMILRLPWRGSVLLTAGREWSKGLFWYKIWQFFFLKKRT